MENEGANSDAQAGAAEPLMQLIRPQGPDLYQVDGAISPNSSNSQIRRSVICNGELSSAIAN